MTKSALQLIAIQLGMNLGYNLVLDYEMRLNNYSSLLDLKKAGQQEVCECEQCMIYGQIKRCQVIINIIRYYDTILSNQFKFECMFCGKDFGIDVMKLALHIGKIHDQARNLNIN